MSYRIAQDFEYAGKDYWRWWAWIDADDSELDQVKHVVWILHPSFKRARVVTAKRSDKFRLTTAGWGTFLLKAEVELTNGETRKLKHNLRLEYPDASGANPPLRSSVAERQTIFLSYSTQDSRLAARLRAGLGESGFDVLDQTRVAAGEPWSEALQRMIAKSDAVVGLNCDDEISSFVSAEIKAAVASSKPAFLLVTADASTAGLPDEVQTLTIDIDHINPTAIAQLLRSA